MAEHLPGGAMDWLTSHDRDWIKTSSDFSAAAADKITAGGTAKLRQLGRFDDVVDYHSDAYRYGGYAGQAVSIALMAANPAGWAGMAVRGINLASMGSGLIDAGMA